MTLAWRSPFRFPRSKNAMLIKNPCPVNSHNFFHEKGGTLESSESSTDLKSMTMIFSPDSYATSSLSSDDDWGCNSRFNAHWKRMKQSKDPFEAAFEEQEDSPPESPADAFETQNPNSVVAQGTLADQEDDISGGNGKKAATQFTPASTAGTSSGPITTATKNKDDDDEEEEENMDVELGKFPSSGDPDKMAKMQAILSQFTEEQMSRYESFRRAGFQKANMKRLLASIIGTQKISVPMTIVVSGIAKMFVGEVVETARIVMKERKESGPIRPCHLREAYRRLKLEGKVFKRSVSRLFR